MKPSQRIQRDVDAIRAFSVAYDALMDEADQVRDVAPGTVPFNDADWQAKRLAVSHESGEANSAWMRWGAVVGIPGAPVVNLLVNWELTLDRPGVVINRQGLQSAMQSALGRAETAKRDAEQRESGGIGLIAGFLRVPIDLREAVGPGECRQRAAFAAGVAVQIFTGVVVGIVVYVIVHVA